MYNWRELDVNTMTNLFLYGERKKPEELRVEGLIPDNRDRANIQIDASDFMTNGGPGRFANASTIHLVNQFFSGQSPFVAKRGVEQTWTGDQMRAQYSAGAYRHVLQQSAFIDGIDDHVQRSYIYETQAYFINKDCKFVITSTGERKIENFCLLPGDEDFDFVSPSGSSNQFAQRFGDRIDPTKIGKTVGMVYSEVSKSRVPRVTYTRDTLLVDRTRYSREYGGLVSQAILAAKLFAGGLFDDLWTGGSTKILDSDGRPVLHGSNRGELLDKDKFLAPDSDNDRGSMYSQLKTAIQNQGLAFIGGGGNDILDGTDKSDYLRGGKGDDRLEGKSGKDKYIIGEGRDTIVDDSAGEGSVETKEKLIFSGGKYINSNTWQSGNTKYISTGSGLSIVVNGDTKNATTINNFDFQMAKQSPGYLGRL